MRFVNVVVWIAALCVAVVSCASGAVIIADIATPFSMGSWGLLMTSFAAVLTQAAEEETEVVVNEDIEDQSEDEEDFKRRIDSRVADLNEYKEIRDGVVEDLKVPFEVPPTEGLQFVETFQDADWKNRWVKVADDRYKGAFVRRERKKDQQAFPGDTALALENPAKFYGAATRVLDKPGFQPSSQNIFRFSYEVKLEEGLQCGGAYVKLFNSSNLPSTELDSFNAETQYNVMFGPDACGTKKVLHMIFQTKFSDKQEYALDLPMNVDMGKYLNKLSHLYEFMLRPDDSAKVLIDGETVFDGNLKDGLTPALDAAPMVPDPKDPVPEGWDPEEEIPDEDAVQPDDWPEDEEETMPDPQDPSKTIPNPAYKGEWKRPMISKGPYVRREIADPLWKQASPYQLLAGTDALGIEIWTMQGGILFDNIVVAHDPKESELAKAMREFHDATFYKRQPIEEKMKQLQDKISDEVVDIQRKNNMWKEELHELLSVRSTEDAAMFIMTFSENHPYLLGASAGIFVVFLSWLLKRCLCRRTPSKEEPKTEAEVAKPTKEKKSTKGEENTKDKSNHSNNKAGGSEKESSESDSQEGEVMPKEKKTNMRKRK